MRTLGAVDSAGRSAEQTAVARFFSGNPVPMYRTALCNLLETEPMGLLPTTRLFARIDAAVANSFIQTWRLKFDVGFWRPFQAIAGAADGRESGHPTEPDDMDAARPQPGLLRLHDRARGGDLTVRPSPAPDPR